MLSRISQHRELAFHHKATPFNSKMKALEENYKLHSGGDVFQDYFDDVKESRVKQVSRIKNQVSSFKNQESRIKNNQDQDSRLKIQESRKDSIKISTKKFFKTLSST